MSVLHFATSAEYPALTTDDRLAVAALRARGISVEPLVWGTPAVADAIVVRSCWDYHLETARFERWIAEHAARLINSATVLRGNLHKRYLVELAAAGVLIPPTVLVQDATSLDAVADQLGTRSLVVKPAISLSAFGTWRIDAIDDAARARFTAQRATGDVLVQSFIPEIVDGELSLVYFGGHYSHAVRKRPARGDFRVQMDFGGTREPVEPGADIVAAATRIVERHAAGTTYARVDGVVTARGFELMELELIDPVLFLGYAPHAAERFASAIVAAMPRGA